MSKTWTAKESSKEVVVMSVQLISVIIPFYNSEQYIGECIKSVLEQSYQNFEIIMVDDGSGNKGMKICKQLEAMDQRIHVVRQTHQGVSEARNTGMKSAKGKYVFFLDSDDIIHRELLENLYMLMEREQAVIATEFFCSEIEEWGEQEESVETYRYLRNQLVLEAMLEGSQGGFSGIGGKMILRNVSASINFDRTLVNGEDTKYIYQLLEKGADAVILNKRWYFYRKHEECASRKITVETCQSRYQSIRYICDQEQANGRKAEAVNWERYLVKCLINWYVDNKETKERGLLKYLRKMAYEEWKKPLFSEIGWKTKINFSLTFYCYPFSVIFRKWLKDQEKKKYIQDQRWLEKVRKREERLQEYNISDGGCAPFGKISVIISVYNSELYIRHCIQSVLNQTYSDLEIIVIDNNSMDRSLLICEELEQSDKRIQTFRLEKEEISLARNFGLDIATGKYIFFLDGDDAIHPLLLEELIRQTEKSHAEIAICEYAGLNLQYIEKNLDIVSKKDDRPRWQVMDKAGAEKWFHTRYEDMKMCVGCLILREFIGALRFETELSHGADTLFMYYLIYNQARITYSSKEWYYRMYPDREQRLQIGVKEEKYFNVYKKIIDSEYQKGNENYALLWERRMVWALRQRYSQFKRERNKEKCRVLRKQALTEIKYTQFQKLTLFVKILFICCFSCYPVYFLLEKPMKLLDKMIWRIRRRKAIRKKKEKIGIITFHCSNNYGAMLQAYGLKWFLRGEGINAEIVRYEPSFLIGRHWWFPYVPTGNIKKSFQVEKKIWKSHRRMGFDFFRQRANYGFFLKKYLVKRWSVKRVFSSQLRNLPYSCYIVGSDQIWNPDITYGLRKVYFGAFKNKKKRRVIAYAASLGSESLSTKYEDQFSELLKNVDVVSVREKEAVPYVKRFCQQDVTAVLDPVFLLHKESWQIVEKIPDLKGYVLVYPAEENKQLYEYALRLADEKGLKAVILRARKWGEDEGFLTEYIAGPAEFLGYIHNAEYVLTNSFHGVAFSIIYQKKFLAFLHSNRGARIRNILSIHDLDNRLYDKEGNKEIDSYIDWDAVKLKNEKQVKMSKDFLLNSIAAGK